MKRLSSRAQAKDLAKGLGPRKLLVRSSCLVRSLDVCASCDYSVERWAHDLEAVNDGRVFAGVITKAPLLINSDRTFPLSADCLPKLANDETQLIHD